MARTVKIYAPRQVSIGSNCVLNDFVHIWGSGGVIIEDETIVAAHTVITSQSHKIEALENAELYRETADNRPVYIGRNVWIGSNVTVLPGIEIGADSVVAAGAVVTRDVPPRTLVAGIPARVVRQL